MYSQRNFIPGYPSVPPGARPTANKESEKLEIEKILENSWSRVSKNIGDIDCFKSAASLVIG